MKLSRRKAETRPTILPSGRDVAVTCLLFTACTMGTPPQTYPMPEPASAPTSVGRLWDTVVDFLTTSSTPIKTIDRASGVIVTEPMAINDAQGQKYADCGKGGLGTSWIANRVSYNVRALGDSSRSTLRLTASFRQVGPGAGLFECTSKGVLESEIASALVERAGRR